MRNSPRAASYGCILCADICDFLDGCPLSGRATPHAPRTAAKNNRHSYVSSYASWPKSDGHSSDKNRGWAKRSSQPLFQNVSVAASAEVVHGVFRSPSFGTDGSLRFENDCLPVLCPNFFLMGILFGVPAGYLEEIGWMGYAFPKMRLQSNALAASILLGLLWSIWHLPVIDYLGTATPHGAYWLPFFLAFTSVMTATRVLICWTIATQRACCWLSLYM
jgi:Type II CAAX prenyl endopeptidase Rce1-like